MPAADLADRFESANREVIDYVLGPAAAAWDTPTAAEGWPVGVTARHIALGHRLVAGWIDALRQGEPITGIEDIDGANAREAARGVVASPQDVAALLQENGARTSAALRQLSDEDLNREVEFGPRRLPGEVVAGAAIRHAQVHLESIRQALGEGPAAG